MLSFLQHTVVDLVDLREGRLLFQSNRAYPEGKEVKIRIAHPPGTNKLVNLKVVVQSVRSLETGGLLYVSEIVGGEIPEENISTNLKDASLRAAARHSMPLRVRSRQLPGFKGMTVDFSRSGLQLEVDAEVPVGLKLTLTVDFDRFDLNPLECAGEIVWCRPLPGRGYRAGLRFVHPDAATQHQVNEVANFIEARSTADLHSLLEQAKLLSQDAGPLPQQIGQEAKAFPAAAAPVAPPVAPPPPPEPEPVPPPPTLAEALPEFGSSDGIVMFVDARIQGAWWDFEHGRAVLVLRGAQGPDQRLEFPECQTLRDYGCFRRPHISRLWTYSDSELLEWIVERYGPGPWRHYQFLDDQEEVTLEVVSAPVQTYAWGAPRK